MYTVRNGDDPAAKQLCCVRTVSPIIAPVLSTLSAGIARLEGSGMHLLTGSVPQHRPATAKTTTGTDLEQGSIDSMDSPLKPLLQEG